MHTEAICPKLSYCKWSFPFLSESTMTSANLTERQKMWGWGYLHIAKVVQPKMFLILSSLAKNHLYSRVWGGGWQHAAPDYPMEIHFHADSRLDSLDLI